jgi:cyd operon protein YbgT
MWYFAGVPGRWLAVTFGILNGMWREFAWPDAPKRSL